MRITIKSLEKEIEECKKLLSDKKDKIIQLENKIYYTEKILSETKSRNELLESRNNNQVNRTNNLVKDIELLKEKLIFYNSENEQPILTKIIQELEKFSYF